jgi:hypothetical protein
MAVWERRRIEAGDEACLNLPRRWCMDMLSPWNFSQFQETIFATTLWFYSISDISMQQRPVLNRTLEDAFRQRYPGFRPANDDQALPKAA